MTPRKKQKNILESHPDHSALIPRIKRSLGQLEGIERMILEKRYCPDIIQQLRAVQSATKAIELEILKTHLSCCIKAAATSEKESAFEEKLKELLELIKN